METPLSLAIRVGDDGTVDLLLKESEREVRWQLDKKNLSRAFLHAFIAKKSNLMDILLARGAEVNEFDSNGCTPLMMAAQGGNLEQARFLLNAKSNVNAAPTGDHTALMLASLRGHLEMVELLLAAGADLNARTLKGILPAPIIQLIGFQNEGNSALNFAVKRGHSAIVGRLLQFDSFFQEETKEKILTKALIDAAKLGFVEIVKKLLAVHDIDINGADSSQCTSLMIASENGHDAVMNHCQPILL